METPEATWDAMTPEQMSHVLVVVFGRDFPVQDARRILGEPTMAELAQYGPLIRQALATM